MPAEKFKIKLERRMSSWYEVLCNYFGKFYEFPLKGEKLKELLEKLEFCDINTKPGYIYTTTIMIAVIGIIFSVILFLLNLQTYGLFVIFSFLGLAYYIIVYPTILTKYYRIRATSDLVQAAFYLVISLRLVPNLERALMFASSNVKGIVGRSLRKMAWGMTVGKYGSADEVLNEFAMKWKQENLEFYEAVNLIRSSISQKRGGREKMLDEAVNILLQGNMERMKHYSTQLRNPLMIITTMGITLPVLTIILFPILTIFLTETVEPAFLFFFYDIVLPLVVWYIMNETLKTRPVTFGTIDISQHPRARPMKKIVFNIFGKSMSIPTLIVSILLGSVFCLFGYYLTTLQSDPVSLTKIMGGLLVLDGVGLAIIFYSFFNFYKNIDIRDEIKGMESEFGEVLFQLGYTLSTGVPVEAALEKSYEKTKDLKISSLFERILSNIKRFGFTLKKALFDKKYGAMHYYPSPMIHSTMDMISDYIGKGVAGVSKAILSISNYLKGMHSVEEHMKEILDETTSSMKMMMNLLVPIASGAVVGMATIMVMVLYQIVSILTNVTGLAGAYPQQLGPDVLGGIVDIKNIMPAEVFLVVVGIYMLEITIMLASFINSLQYGDDPLDKHYLITTNVVIGLCIFSFSVLLIYFIFKGLIGFIWMG
jgi:hypothetical protein